MQKKTVLITGASSGIGKAVAERLASPEFRLILCGRRQERLDAMRDQLKDHTEITTLNFDVRDKAAVKQALDSLEGAFRRIDVLVNNAGNAHGLDLIHEGDTDDWDAMLDINVKGLLYVTRAILPQMTERRSGHLIHIGSTAGKEVYPRGNVYCASKHAVDALNEAMRLDLNEFGIKVSAIHPGLVETEFSEVRFKGDTDRAKQVYEGYQPLKPEDVADILHFVLTRPAHVNVADLVVMPTDQASSTIVKKDL